MAQIFHCKAIYLYTINIYKKMCFIAKKNVYSPTAQLLCPKNIAHGSFLSPKNKLGQLFFARPLPKRVVSSLALPRKHRVSLAQKIKKIYPGDGPHCRSVRRVSPRFLCCKPAALHVLSRSSPRSLWWRCSKNV